MITILQYPSDSYNLADFINTVRKNQHFSMQISWQYNENDALEIVVQFKSAEQQLFEQLLCAELSGMGFLYVHSTVLPVSAVYTHLKHYNFLPDTNEVPLFSNSALSVLLSSLLHSKGKITIDVDADAKDVRIALSADVDNPLLINHAFGHCFKVAFQDGGGRAFFVAQKELQEKLLQLPFLTNENGLLISGFGSHQASNSLAGADILIGSVEGDILGRTLLMTPENLTSSTVITGVSGYGKSTLVKNLVIQTYEKQQIPFLIVEPAKDEYRDLKAEIPELQVISVLGDYSPLAPPRGVSPYIWSDVFVELVATAMNIPEDSSLRAHYREAYVNCIVNKSSILQEFVRLTERYSDRQIDYKENGIHMLKNFFRYFNSDSTQKKKERFPVEEFLSRPTVISLGHIPSPAMKSCFLYFVIKHIQAFLMHQKSEKINHLLVLEEAHHILGKDVSQHLLEEVVNIIREARSQGLSTIYADQSANALSEQAIAQAGNIITLRQTSVGDQEAMASSILCQPEEINLLPKYTAMIRLNQMYYPSRVKLIKIY